LRNEIYGVGFDNVDINEATDIALALMDREHASYVVTPNAEILWMCHKEEKLRKVVNDADMVLPDGIGVVYGAKILKRPLKSKVAGCDFAEKLMDKMQNTGKSVFLFGAKPGVADKAAENLKEKYPGLIISGTNDGYFKDDKPIIEKINSAKPDLLLVCLGVPKQEFWMSENKDKLNAKVMAGLGGSLDVFAGVVERAPAVWQKLGLEWLYRLIKEPKRIKRMSSLPLFLFAVIWQRITGK